MRQLLNEVVHHYVNLHEEVDLSLSKIWRLDSIYLSVD